MHFSFYITVIICYIFLKEFIVIKRKFVVKKMLDGFIILRNFELMKCCAWQSQPPPLKGNMMMTLKKTKITLKYYLTAELQRAQSFLFFLLFAETPKSKTTQPFG